MAKERVEQVLCADDPDGERAEAVGAYNVLGRRGFSGGGFGK